MPLGRSRRDAPGGEEAGEGARRAVTSRDVARRAGVSQSVVSRALSGDRSVAAATREAVLGAAASLGYHRNLLARTMITRRSGIIALVTGEMRTIFFFDALRAVAAEVRRRGYQLLWQPAEQGADVEDAMRVVLQYQADGVFVGGATPSPAALEASRAQRVPIVQLFRHSADERLSAVSSDNVGSARAVADHLSRLGHRAFAVVRGHEPATAYDAERARGFRERLLELGHPEPVHVAARECYEDGVAVGRALLGGRDPVDAVFAITDATAFGVLDAARGLGLRPGRDVSVVGFNDTEPAVWASYGLSTVRQDLAGIAEAGLDLLLAEVADPDRAPRTILVPAEIVLRTSTRPPPVRIRPGLPE